MSFDDEKEGPQMPSWLIEDNDKRHVQETVAPLFGTGAINLLDASQSVAFAVAPPPSKSSQQDKAAATSSYGSTGVTAQQNKGAGGQQKRTTEQAAQEIQSLAKAYNKLQQQKQQAEENRRLFSQQKVGDDWNSDDGLDSSVDNSSMASSSKKKNKNKTTNKQLVDAFGPTTIDSPSRNNDNHDNIDEQDEDNDDDDMNDEEKQALLLKEQLKPHIPKQNACLWFFHLLAGFSVVVLLCLVATQIIPVVAVKRAANPHDTTQWWQKIGIFSLALKVYISIFSLCFCMVELHLPMPFLRSANLLQNFISRGFIYSFVGLVATSEAYQEHVQNAMTGSSSSGNKPSAAAAIPGDSLAKEVPWLAIFMQVSAWVMLGIGFFYTLMGLCCLQPLFERLREQERLDWQKYRTDYRAWKRVYGKK